jgi:hypothetical protein
LLLGFKVEFESLRGHRPDHGLARIRRPGPGRGEQAARPRAHRVRPALRDAREHVRDEAAHGDHREVSGERRGREGPAALERGHDRRGEERDRVRGRRPGTGTTTEVIPAAPLSTPPIDPGT